MRHLFALVAFSGLAFGQAAHSIATPPSMTSVVVLDDRLRPVDGGVVVVNDGQDHVLVTDEYGQTPWIEGAQPETFLVTFGESSTSAGTLVGMIQEITTPYAPRAIDDYHENWVLRTQAVARRYMVDNDVTMAIGAPHWYAVAHTPTLQFPVDVASLLDGEMVGEYFAFRRQLPLTNYARGLLLIFPGVQLGDAGISVGINLLGALPGDVEIDAYHFVGTPGLSPTGPPLSVSLAFVEDGYAVVKIRGAVQGGHLALLARSASEGAGRLIVLKDDPVTVAIGEGPTDPPPPVDCIVTPPLPPPNWDCRTVPSSGPSPNCPPCKPASSSSHECTVMTQKSPPFCREPGTKLTKTVGTTKSFKVTFGLSPSEGSPINAESGFTYGVSSTTIYNDEWTAGLGIHGRGQCTQYFVFHLICYDYLVCYRDVHLDGDPFFFPCVSDTQDAVCVEAYSSQNSCSRSTSGK